MVTTVAIAGSEEGLGPFEDLALLEAALERCDLRPRRLVWDAPGHSSGTPAAVLLRHTWDYHRQPGAFIRWLRQLETRGVPVFNGVEMVLENMHKAYLLDLGAQGFPIPPSALLRQGEEATLPALFRDHREVIVKPAISASSWRTFRIDPRDRQAFAAAVATIHRDGDALVQGFVPEIHRGEWSLVYLGGAFSHAVLKRPVEGEFRVQCEFGGRYTVEEPSTPLRAMADRLIARWGTDLAFARVDLVEADEGPLLMELELIEPDLMLRLHPPAADRLATWLAERMRREAP